MNIPGITTSIPGITLFGSAPKPIRLASRFAIAAGLAATGYLHADLFLNHGYRYIPNIGPAFQWQAAASFAMALLIAFGAPQPWGLITAGFLASDLGGFVLSRTVGLFGFTETGFNPAPQALITVLVESTALLLTLPAGFIWLPKLPLGRRNRPATAEGRF